MKAGREKKGRKIIMNLSLGSRIPLSEAGPPG